MGAALTSGLAVAGVAVVFALLRAGAARPAPRDPATGDLVLQCGRGLVWGAGLMAAGGPLFMAALSLVIPFKSPEQVFVPIGLGAFFLLIGGPMAWWAVRRRTRVGAAGLTSEYMFAGPRFLPWNRVTRVTFASGQEFWVCGGRGEKAMLHVWFVGVRDAVPLLRAHLPGEVRAKCRGTLDRFAEAVGAVPDAKPGTAADGRARTGSS